MTEHASVVPNPVIIFAADRVAFGPRTAATHAAYTRWHNDFSTWALETPVALRPTTFDAVAARYDATAAEEQAERLHFTVYDRVTMTPVGFAELLGVDRGNRSAFLAARVFEPEDEREVLQVEALRLLMDYAFTVLGLHSLAVSIPSFAGVLLACHERAGFKPFVRRRHSLVRAGRPGDIVYLDALSTEFTSPWLGATLQPDIPREGRAS